MSCTLSFHACPSAVPLAMTPPGATGPEGTVLGGVGERLACSPSVVTAMIAARPSADRGGPRAPQADALTAPDDLIKPNGGRLDGPEQVVHAPT